MIKPSFVLGLLFLIILTSTQRVGRAPCPLQYQLGSVVSARITIAQSRGIIPFVRGQDVQCYNYSLPYPFARVPEIAIAVHDFEAQKSDDLFFSVKSTKSQSLSYVPLLVRTHWKYTEWQKISFSILAQDRTDIESGYYQVDSGALGGCQPGKNIHVLLPFRTLAAFGNVNHNLFLHGFQISSQPYSMQQKSPFEIQIIDSRTNSSGILIYFTVTTITQVHALHLSYVAWEATDLTLVSGKYSQDIMSISEISHTPESNVGRNYARIFGLTGFIVNNNYQEMYYATHWSGAKFNFDFDVSTPFVNYISFQYLFFLGSECSDCPNYPYIFEGQCRQFCPQGYYATGEEVCINCGQGHYWNGTACVKECPVGQLLNIASNECECPTGLHWNGVQCIDCIGGKIFNYEKKKCQCPEGTRWNGFGCATITVCTDGRIWNVFNFLCECPHNSFWNGTFCVKIVTCTNGRVADENNGCKCPDGTYWNDQWCEAHGCNGGRVWNGTACACQSGYNFNGSLCLLCINGQEWNERTRKCVCPSQHFWNGNYCQRRVSCSGGRVWNATVQQCLCTPDKFWNGASCMVQPECCCGKTWNQTSFQCNCPANFNWDGSSCLLCINGKVWDQDKQQCVCRQGTKWNGHFCVVIQECYGGMVWNQNTWSCECPAVMVWNGRYCMANPCLGGQVWDNMARRCNCPTGLQFINNLCQRPQVYCDSPKIWDSTVLNCVCPPGYFDNTITCVPIPVCPGNQFRNPNNNQCQCQFGLVWIQQKNSCTDPTCPENQRWDGNGCIKISCPPNSYFNGTECICPDPRDYCKPWQYYDGVRCVYQPGTCPQGTAWNGTYCIPENKCPVGFYALASDCSPLPQRCVPPTVWSNNRCQVGSGCPHGSYFRSGNCMPYVPCQQGQVWNNDMVNCVCPQGTEWNGDRCLSCNGGKIWEPFNGCQCPTGYYFTGARCERFDSARCSLVPNAFWDGQQCVCHEGFSIQGMSCECDGVIIGNRCDRCAHRPNSEWRFGKCRCKAGYTLFGTQCLGNQVGNDSPQTCNVGTFYDRQQRMCLPCPSGCLNCESSFKCLTCTPEFSFDPTSELCIEHCGDGKKYILQCDDGNNIDGDGCSFSCQVEPGYTCRGGSPNHHDSCVIHLPSQITLVQTGQIRYNTKIVVNVKIDYLPKNLLQSSDCNDRCSNVLDGKLRDGDTNAVSIKSSYISGTIYTFSVEIEFSRTYIGQFTLQIKVNPAIASQYFTGVGTANVLSVVVNPALLSKVVDEEDIAI